MMRVRVGAACYCVTWLLGTWLFGWCEPVPFGLLVCLVYGLFGAGGLGVFVVVLLGVGCVVGVCWWFVVYSADLLWWWFCVCCLIECLR